MNNVKKAGTWFLFMSIVVSGMAAFTPPRTGYVAALAGVNLVTAAAMEGMDMDGDGVVDAPPAIPAGRPKNSDYKPVERAADDSSMAVVVASVFGLPVGAWLAARYMKKSRRSKK